MISVRIGWLALCVAATGAAQSTEQDYAVVQRPAPYQLKLAMKTRASRERIWSLWVDVANWKQFDTLLEYAYLQAPKQFVSGAKGVVKAHGSPKTRFQLFDVVDGKSFTEKLKLPFYQSIDLLRYFEDSADGSTVFVHEVHFKGGLRWLSCALACNTFKKELPLVMQRLKTVAENGSLDRSSQAD